MSVDVPRKTVRSDSMPSVPSAVIPEWPAPARVRSLVTKRGGGVSAAPYASFNLADHVGDDPFSVARNRQLLAAILPAQPCWLRQIHGARVVDAATLIDSAEPVEADGSVTRQAGVVCAVLTADCLPVLLCDRQGSVVAVAHAGWRGLQAGIIEQAIAAMGVRGDQLLAYLGPAIGPQAFVVGSEVRRGFIADDPEAEAAFAAARRPVVRREAARPGERLRTIDRQTQPERWLADIYLLARQRLARLGVSSVYGGDCCTVRQEKDFYSYRRDGVTGRMASMIWLDAE